jgi:hypothetical protein
MHAHEAGLRLVDTVYDEDTFTLRFVVPWYEDATEAEIYQLRARLFYSEFLKAPWTVGKVHRTVNETTKLVMYRVPLVPSNTHD